MRGLRPRAGRRLVTTIMATATAAGLGGALVACDAAGEAHGAQTTITLAGPNQWTTDPRSFGPGWEEFVGRFEAETGIDVETTVLPLDQFSRVISTQLAAGTAPELVFNQAPHDPSSVIALDEYLAAPNPFVPGNRAWIDVFDPRYFGYDTGTSVNGRGDLEWIPFNLISLGVFYNADILDEAGVQTPLRTYGDYLRACDAVRARGYDGFAMDSTFQGQGQLTNLIWNMLAAKHVAEWNVHDGDGSPGSTASLTQKSQARAIATGRLSATGTPEVGETLRLVKEFLDRCATPDWSGVPGSGGPFVNTPDFVAGRAAMALGSNLAAAEDALDFRFAAMPFGTVSEQDSPLSTGAPAQSGLSAGGTAYMIAATAQGEQLDAAVRFLQYASSPAGVQTFLDATGGLPAIVDAEPAPGVEGLIADQAWTQPMAAGAFPSAPKARATEPLVDGYLIGQLTLTEQLEALQSSWEEAVAEQIQDNGWMSQDWARSPR